MIQYYSMNKKIWYLQQLDLFADLAREKLHQIESLFHMRDYNKREVIFEPGDQNKVFIVKTGRVEVYQLNSLGKKIIIEILKTGSFFGDLGSDSPTETYVEATVDSCVCSLDKHKFFSLISREPKLAEKLMKNLFNRLLLVEKRASSLAIDNAFQRFIKLLLSIGKRPATNSEDMQLADIYTHEELAQMLGISRQTMTTLINRMEKQNLLSREGKKLKFNKTQLEKLTS